MVDDAVRVELNERVFDCVGVETSSRAERRRLCEA